MTDVPFIDGVMFTSYGVNAFAEPQTSTSLLKLRRQVNPSWIGLNVPWFMANKNSTNISRYEGAGGTVNDARLLETIRKAKDLGFKVKVHLIVDSLDKVWRGQITPSDWNLWFASYRAFVNYYAQLFGNIYARLCGDQVDMLCIGCEMKTATPFDSQWRRIIAEARSYYDGPLTYSANHDSDVSLPNREWSYITWWDALDYAGIDGYFELTNSVSPTLDELIQAWQTYRSEIESWFDRIQIPLIFGEIGFKSRSGGNISVMYNSGIGDAEEQADCMKSFFCVFHRVLYRFKGLFWWNWSYDDASITVDDQGTSINNKPSTEVLRYWYQRLKAERN